MEVPVVLNRGARGVMVIVVGNRHGDTSSNPRVAVSISYNDNHYTTGNIYIYIYMYIYIVYLGSKYLFKHVLLKATKYFLSSLFIIFIMSG